MINISAEITVIILTYNEELNIASCIKSVEKIARRIIVMDSYSTDNTVLIAKNLGAEVYQNKFINHAQQFNHALNIVDIKTKWVFRLDADERLTKESAEEVEELCNTHLNTDINGIIVRFNVNFLGRNLRYGGIYPFKKLLIFKYGLGEIENRNMDEHIVLSEGKSIELKNDSIHHDYKNLEFWTKKHNNYSSKEVLDYFDSFNVNSLSSKLNRKSKFKRFIKFKIYYKLPLGFRPLLYFLYRYIFKLGFLDGKEGLIFAFLQAYWYRFLVDAKIYEYKKKNNYKGLVE